MGMLKGKTAIKIFKSYPALKKKPYLGNHFGARGYCSSTIGLDEEMLRTYVKYQEEQEKKEEAQQLNFDFSNKHDWAAPYGGKPKPPSKKVDIYSKPLHSPPGETL